MISKTSSGQIEKIPDLWKSTAKYIQAGAQIFGFLAGSFFALVRYLLHDAGPPRSGGPGSDPTFFPSSVCDDALTPTGFQMTF